MDKQTITSRQEIPNLRITKGPWEALSPSQMIQKILTLHILISLREEVPSVPSPRFSKDSTPSKKVP